VSLSWDVPPDGGSELYGFKIEGYSVYGKSVMLPVTSFLLVSLIEHEWVQLVILPVNITNYQLSASDAMNYADFRISAFNQYGSSETVVFKDQLVT